MSESAEPNPTRLIRLMGLFIASVGPLVTRADHLTRARLNLRDETSSLATSREEIAANQFAAALLMPADWVHHYVEQHLDLPWTKLVRELAREFDVSEQAMEFRLINLGLRAAP